MLKLYLPSRKLLHLHQIDFYRANDTSFPIHNPTTVRQNIGFVSRDTFYRWAKYTIWEILRDQALWISSGDYAEFIVGNNKKIYEFGWWVFDISFPVDEAIFWDKLLDLWSGTLGLPWICHG